MVFGARAWMVPALLMLGMGCVKKPKSEAADGGSAAVSDPADPNGQAPSPASADSILVGIDTSLTGGEATFGISTREGVELAFREINAAGGVKGKRLVTRIYDNQGRPEEAANAMTRLINQDHVALVLGDVASSNSLAMAPKAQAARVPMITPSSTNPKVTEVGDYVFRVCFIDPFQGFAMAKYARETLKEGRVAVLKDQKSDYSLGLTDVFTRKFTELGGKILAQEAYSKGDTDFRAQLTAIKKLKPEAIYVPGYYTDVGLIARQARELGLRVPLLGGDGWDSEKLFELGGSAIEGSYFTNHYALDTPSEQAQKFVADYKQAFNHMPDALAALAYDAARLAADAMIRAPDLNGTTLREAIAATRDFPGVAGKVNFDEHRNAVKTAVVLQVTGGRAKYVASVEP